MINPKFHLQYLSDYRTPLMGLATIMIVACHAPASNVMMPKVLHHLLGLGNFGVDIFLFLSGLGCWYSLAKQKTNYLQFITKRLKRIGIPYLVIFIPYVIILFCLGEYTVTDCVLGISSLEYWVYHRGAWFVSLMIPLYLFTPVLYRVLQGRWKWAIVTILILALIVLSGLPATSEANNNVFSNIQFALSRVPSFILGFAIAKECKANTSTPLYVLLIVTISFFVFNRFFPDFFLKWMLLPLVLYAFVLFCKWAVRHASIYGFLCLLGVISLESYLFNININALFRVLIPSYIDSPIFYGRYLEYALVIVVGFLLSYYVHKVVERYFRLK